MERTESRAMQEVREARTRLHDELKNLTPEERQAFFEREHRVYQEWIASIQKNDGRKGESDE